MGITDSDLWLLRAAATSDAVAAQNGGRASGNRALDNVKNNVFPDVGRDQRLAGLWRYRKVFYRNANASRTPLINPRLFIPTTTPGDDYLMFRITGSHTDTQDLVPTGARWYGVATLAAAVPAGATQLVLNLEHAEQASSYRPFAANDLLYVHNRTAGGTGDGSEEPYLTVAATGISYANGQVTLPLAAPTTYAWDPAVATVYVAAVYQAASPLQATVDAPVAASASGAYAAGSATVDFRGTILQAWTIVITNSATGAFRLDGDALGAGVATGTRGADFAPVNPQTGFPYFTLPSTGWSGSWANGDSLVFSTTAADVPVWLVHRVPAGARSIAADIGGIALDGEGG